MKEKREEKIEDKYNSDGTGADGMYNFIKACRLLKEEKEKNI